MLKRKGKEFRDMCSSKEKDLSVLLDEAERAMKKIEIKTGKFFSPSLNEIRYSFIHYLKYQNEKNEDDYLRAKNHILRAIYDAKDAMLMGMLDNIYDFEKAYKSVSICSVIPNWVDINSKLNDIRECLSDKNFKNRYAEFDEAHNYLENLVKTINAAIPELDKIRRNDFWCNPFLVATITAVITALISYFIGII